MQISSETLNAAHSTADDDINLNGLYTLRYNNGQAKLKLSAYDKILA